MAFLILNDETPFAEEYDNYNYYFDANDPDSFKNAVRLLAQMSNAQKNTPAASHAKRGLSNCKDHYSQPGSSENLPVISS